MPDTVKTRPYDSERRRHRARQTRLRILEAAQELFTRDGYAGTEMAAVAEKAGVSVDTVYASVGRKPRLLLAVHDLVLGDGDTDAAGRPRRSEERAYVAEIRGATTALRKIEIYAETLSRLLPRSAPLLEALREAGHTDPECLQVWREVEERRARNLRLYAQDLLATGELRTDLRIEEVADLIWSMGPSHYLALAGRGWTPDRYGALLREVWSRTLLR